MGGICGMNKNPIEKSLKNVNEKFKINNEKIIDGIVGVLNSYRDYDNKVNMNIDDLLLSDLLQKIKQKKNRKK